MKSNLASLKLNSKYISKSIWFRYTHMIIIYNHKFILGLSSRWAHEVAGEGEWMDNMAKVWA